MFQGFPDNIHYWNKEVVLILVLLFIRVVHVERKTF